MGYAEDLTGKGGVRESEKGQHTQLKATGTEQQHVYEWLEKDRVDISLRI